MGIKSIFLYRLWLRLTSFLEKTQDVLVNKYYSLKLSILELNAADHLLYGPISKSDRCGDMPTGSPTRHLIYQNRSILLFLTLIKVKPARATRFMNNSWF